LFGDQPISAVNNHNRFAWRQKWDGEFWMEKDIEFFLPTHVRDRYLVPVGFVKASHKALFHVAVAGKKADVGRITIQQQIFVRMVDS